MAKGRRELPVVAFKSQQAFAAWLTSQPENSRGLWLKIAKKSSGIPSISRMRRSMPHFAMAGSMASSTVLTTNIG
jgi:uncharacterized protein YdeI (YjbR/CyaY-like superfamily)